MAENPFVLDEAGNPHPKLLAGALNARRAAGKYGAFGETYWRGYRDAMLDATGATIDELSAWLDSHS